MQDKATGVTALQHCTSVRTCPHKSQGGSRCSLLDVPMALMCLLVQELLAFAAGAADTVADVLVCRLAVLSVVPAGL